MRKRYKALLGAAAITGAAIVGAAAYIAKNPTIVVEEVHPRIRRCGHSHKRTAQKLQTKTRHFHV